MGREKSDARLEYEESIRKFPIEKGYVRIRCQKCFYWTQEKMTDVELFASDNMRWICPHCSYNNKY